MLGEELLVLDDQLLELLDLVVFETLVPGHDPILAPILHRSSCTSASARVVYYLFDVIVLAGQDMRRQPLDT